MTLYDLTVTAFTQQSRALLGQMAKAETWCVEQGVTDTDMLDTRLAPDMHPLSVQFDFVVAQLLQPMRRLTGQALADPEEAGPTLAAHNTRIKAALVMIAALPAAEVNGDPARMIELILPNGMTFDLSAADYVRDWAVPQFFFHIMAAYTLMRHRGVPLGKADYVPHMVRHARRPSAS
jgi:hypothetical protein